MFGSQSSSSSQESQGSQGFSASLSGTLRYIGETIAQYTGLGSQTPPASQPHQPESLAETDDEIVLLPTPESNIHSRRLRTGAVSVQPGTGLKVRDYAYKNPLPPLKICKCCEPQALIERMARAPTPTLPYVVASPSSPSRNARATVTPIASTSRAPLRPLKRSRPHRGGRIAGLNDLAFMPPEYFKPSQPKTSPSQDSSSNEERPAKRQRTLQREDAEPSLFGQSKRPSQSPKSAPRTPPRNQPIWLGAGPRNLFSPTTTPSATPTATPTTTPVAGTSTPGRTALLAQFDADATPTPPYLPTELPKYNDDDNSFLGPTEETHPDEPMEDVILTLTASITPQASEVFSDWSGFSRVSSISSISRPSTPVSRPLGSKLVWSERAPSEESLDSFDSTMSGKTLVSDEHPQVQAGPSSPSSHYQLRPRPPNSASHGTSPLASPRSPSRKNTTHASTSSSAPRKTSTTTPRFARRRDVSPTLSLTLTKHTLPTSASSSTRSSSPRTYHKSLMTKTRSTMSREKTMSAIKPAVRRSPRTKNHAAVVVAAARNLKLACGMVSGARGGSRGQRRVGVRRVGVRRVRC